VKIILLTIIQTLSKSRESVTKSWKTVNTMASFDDSTKYAAQEEGVFVSLSARDKSPK